ncbi:type 1 glutamine amidotransferase domain-containing protein [uncultured Imperialibacter sp.]|uniref:type 1 glutamine amidotransferase domain-containing protein n=1 Tax=uncultured Imperialibacter sp. TaxID=1672639 RepID=UPI0030D95666|tara:strand:+ start:2119 stop:3231 length:1113 start_codon:yes stop_codon:yes gene_type:complete
MSKKKTIIKWAALVVGGLIITLVSFGYWFLSLLPAPVVSKEVLRQTQPENLPYLVEGKAPNRGKILAVVTSTAVMGNSEKPTGYELTELARAYYVFQANGFEVEIASPLGGTPPVVIDADDMREYDYAFLNDEVAQNKVTNSLAMQDVKPDDYQAVFFVGGKGAMFDFPKNTHIQSLVLGYYESGKVIGAVCHGPAAFVNVTLGNGEPLIANKTISSFTNEEELLLIPDARDIFPFLLQDKLMEKGANFNEGSMYLNQVSSNGNLITGQNPWSTWSTAESVVEQLGYTPKRREITTEENSVAILQAYETGGYDKAKETLSNYCSSNINAIDRELLAVHSIVAAMQFDLLKAIELIQLLSFSSDAVINTSI